jgi:glycosyltransferase involved in cell wall biosynthesis
MDGKISLVFEEAETVGLKELATILGDPYPRETEKRTLLSVLIPLYNEEKYIEECLRRVLNAPLPRGTDLELVIVDDGSTDGSLRAAAYVHSLYPQTIRLLRHHRNQGKGAAMRTALNHASGEFCIIQDADLEYSPKEYPSLLRPLYAGEADAVFGSRYAAAAEHRVLPFWHSLGNHFLTLCCNMLSNLNLTDMETCYKAFRTSLVRSIPLRSQRFGIEPELTIKLAQRRARIYETPISYCGRTYQEGKKIGLSDAFQTVLVILRYGLLQRDIHQM